MEEILTPLENAMANKQEESKKYIRELTSKETEILGMFKYGDILYNTQSDAAGQFPCIFIGHTCTDLDSVASSIACEYLFNGIAARASDINDETKYVLNRFSTEPPESFPSVLEKLKSKFAEKDIKHVRVCLLDHNQTTQMAQGIDHNSVVAIIDHHALQANTLQTNKPILVDIRPWGSTCTIISRLFVKHRRPIPEKIAGILLGGILSDTLNLRSPTTTEVDKVMVALLAQLLNYDQDALNDYAKCMFTAKSASLAKVSPHAIVVGDHKVFSFGSDKIGFGVVETVDPTSIISRKTDLITELKAIRKELGLQYSYFAVVDLVNLKSTLLIAGPCERELALEGFGFNANQDGSDSKRVKDQDNVNELDLGSRVSRKKDFIPALSATLQMGWKPSENAIVEQNKEQEDVDVGVITVEETVPQSIKVHVGECCIPIRKPNKFKSTVLGILSVNRLVHGAAMKSS